MLIPSKLICSYRLQNSVERTNLLSLLNSAHNYPLVLISAPAGYGKTTLISQWAKNKPNIGWFSLDEGDNQIERFSTYFCAALAKATDGQCGDEDNTTHSNLFSIFSQQLVKLAQCQKHCYLILDDYHLIDNEDIHEALKYWIKHQPEMMTLILISRSLPPLGIANLRAQEQLLEINAHQLPFSHQESITFFKSRLDTLLTDQEITALCDEVEGWPTALQLISLSAKQQKMPIHHAAKRLSRFNSSHINDYLNDEVFSVVDEYTRKFILRCSILRSMNENLVSKVTGDKNSFFVLETLEKQGLFLQRMDSDENWWRFHPLFASFLIYCCQRELSGEIQELHHKASQEWLKQGYVTEAMYHASQLDNKQLLLKILSDNGWQLFHRGELKLLESCLEHLDDEGLVAYPNLVLLKAWLAQSQHRHNEVAGIFSHFEKQNISLSPENQAEFDVLLAQVAINSGDEDTALSLASNALNRLPNNAYYAQIVATSIIGEAWHVKGNFADAITMLQKAEKMARQYRTSHNVLWTLLQQSEILIAQGFLQAAYDMLNKAMVFVQENHLQQIPMYEFLLRLKGQILWDWYSLDKAEDMANAGISVLNSEEASLQCLAILCKISIVRGDLDNATRLLEKITSLQNSHNYHSDWNANADQVKIVLWQMMNNVEEVNSWLVQNHPPTTDTNHFSQVQWRNIARAKILIGQYDEAKSILDKLIKTAEKLCFTSDLNRALILRNRLHFLTNNREAAMEDLHLALSLTKQTNFISVFVIEGEIMAQQIRQLLSQNTLDEIVAHKAQFILRHINQYYRHKFAHFDEEFVANLLNNPQMPELLKISPLTQREWQVLGLIYSGYSNEQISEELQVAMTTIKTHIRNLYQKFGVSNRNEAIQYTRELLRLMGYH